MDVRDSAGAGGAAREQGEVRAMAGPGFLIVVTLMLVVVPVWALIWGQKEPPPTVSLLRDPGPQRLEPGRRANEVP
jgi:hypothetical protein